MAMAVVCKLFLLLLLQDPKPGPMDRERERDVCACVLPVALYGFDTYCKILLLYDYILLFCLCSHLFEWILV